MPPSVNRLWQVRNSYHCWGGFSRLLHRQSPDRELRRQGAVIGSGQSRHRPGHPRAREFPQAVKGFLRTIRASKTMNAGELCAKTVAYIGFVPPDRDTVGAEV